MPVCPVVLRPPILRGPRGGDKPPPYRNDGFAVHQHASGPKVRQHGVAPTAPGWTYTPETKCDGACSLNNQRNSLFIFFTIILAVASIIIDWPQKPSNYLPDIIPWPESQGLHIDIFNFHRQGFRLGLDLQGGTHLLLRADTSKVAPGDDPSSAIDGVLRVIEKRLNAYGVAETIVQKSGTDRIIVELPGVKNIEEAKSLVGKTAQLDFREQKTIEGKQQYVTASATGTDGIEKPLTGQFFKKAEMGFEQSGKPEILFEFNPEGAKLFGDITTRLKGKSLGIFLDDEALTTPTVTEPITGGKGRITGSFTLDEARKLVIELNAGALPLPVSIEEERTVDATLGADSVRKSVIAGEIALVIIVLFMVLYYRMLGLIASTALILYTLTVLAVFKLIPVTLTLAGIAGFILSIGMAVDANILIFERMKEELRTGRTVASAIESGWGRAWPSIRDSNISTLITCGILVWFGSNFGSSIVAGFAFTLIIGVLISMFSAVVVTRSFLRIIIGRKATIDPTMLGMPAARPGLEPARAGFSS
ncbi:MAG: protein-export rane protein SecD, preprotein translocase subunit SecD [Chloroflexi bacterium]|nr:protein-export rane protein SecD, preprotein translocase subunit SecD [Chloroflexota bacterium]